jgi:hypothetical protein
MKPPELLIGFITVLQLFCILMVQQWNNGAAMGPGYGDAFQTQQIKSNLECNMGKSKPAG